MEGLPNPLGEPLELGWGDLPPRREGALGVPGAFPRLPRGRLSEPWVGAAPAERREPSRRGDSSAAAMQG